MANRIVWVDIPVRDLDRAIAFYSAVMGVKVTREGGPGFTMGLFPHENDSVGGCLYEAGADNEPGDKGPLIYIDAGGSVKRSVEQARKHGGKILQDTHAIGPHGFRALVLDSEGNRIALHSMTE